MDERKSNLSPMDRALGYLTSRDRTEYEMREYLDRCQFGEADIERTIDRLLELRLLDDASFAERFVKTRLAAKPLSKAYLRRKLSEHHVPSEIIASALETVPENTEDENALAIAEKFCRQFASLDPTLRKQRVMRRLEARGFSYDVCTRAYETAVSNAEEETE